jgi:hypothetical protein
MRKKIAPTRKLRGRATGKEDSKAIPSVKVGPSEEPGEVTTDANANQSSDPYGTSALDPEGATSASPGGGDKVENPLARKSEGVQVSNKEGVSYSEVGGIKGGCTSIHNEKQEGTDAIAKKKQGKPNARKKSDGLGEGHSNKTCAKSEPAEEETDACGRAVANNNVSSANQPEEPEGTSALSGHEHEVGDQQGVDSAKEFGRKTSEVDDNKYSDELERSVKEPAHEKAVESTKNATAEQLAEPEGNSTFSGRHEAGNQERLTNVGEFCERTSAKDEVSCSEAGGITAGSAIIQDEQEGRADALIKTKQGRMKAASPDNPHSDDENPESEADLRGHGKSEKDTWGSKRKRSRSKNTLEAEARAKASFGSGNESDEKRRSDERPDRYNANDMKARKMKDSSSHKRSTPVSRTADEMHDDATEPGDRGIAHRESAEKEKAEPSLRKASSEVAYGVDLGDRNVGGKGQKGDQEEGGLPGKEPKPSEKPLSKLSISAGDADLPLSTADAPAPGRNRSRLSIEPAKATDASTSSDYPVGSLLWAREVSINPLWPAVVYDPAYVPTRTLRELKRPQSSKIFWLGHKLFSNMPQENKRGKPYRVPANPQKDEQLCAAARNQYKREPPELALLDDAMKQLKELEKYNAQDMQAWMCEESKRMDGWTPEDFLQAHADWMAEDPDGMKAYMDDKFQREDEEESESQSEQSVDSSKGEPLPAKAKVPKSSKRRRPPADESEGEEEEGVLPANSKVPKSSKRKRSPADASEGEEEEVLPAKSKVPKSSKRGRTPMHSRESEGEIWAAKSKALKSSKPKRTRSDSDESEGETWSAKVQVPKSSKSKPTRRRATAPKRVRSDGITLELGPPIATPKSDYDLAYLKDAKPAVLRKVLKKVGYILFLD